MLRWEYCGPDWRTGLVPTCTEDLIPTNDTRINSYNSQTEQTCVLRESQNINNTAEKLIILTFQAYCRYASLKKRLQEGLKISKSELTALGGIISQDRATRIVFCRESFSCTDIERYHFYSDAKAPILKGRPRKKRKQRCASLDKELKRKRFLAELERVKQDLSQKKAKFSEDEDGFDSDYSEDSSRSSGSNESAQVNIKRSLNGIVQKAFAIQHMKVIKVERPNASSTLIYQKPTAKAPPPLIPTQKVKSEAYSPPVLQIARVKPDLNQAHVDTGPPPLCSVKRVQSYCESAPKLGSAPKPVSKCSEISEHDAMTSSTLVTTPVISAPKKHELTSQGTLGRVESIVEGEGKLLKSRLGDEGVKDQGKENLENNLENNKIKRKRLRQPGNMKEYLDDYADEDERYFMRLLREFMKSRETPISKIPALGFKRVNLWTMYNTTQRLGGYEMVTSKRLWRQVYDALGGSTTITSAATYTRRHYERLLLPYERYVRGQLHKPESSPSSPEDYPDPTNTQSTIENNNNEVASSVKGSAVVKPMVSVKAEERAPTSLVTSRPGTGLDKSGHQSRATPPVTLSLAGKPTVKVGPTTHHLQDVVTSSAASQVLKTSLSARPEIVSRNTDAPVLKTFSTHNHLETKSAGPSTVSKMSSTYKPIETDQRPRLGISPTAKTCSTSSFIPSEVTSCISGTPKTSQHRTESCHSGSRGSKISSQKVIETGLRNTKTAGTKTSTVPHNHIKPTHYKGTKEVPKISSSHGSHETTPHINGAPVSKTSNSTQNSTEATTRKTGTPTSKTSYSKQSRAEPSTTYSTCQQASTAQASAINGSITSKTSTGNPSITSQLAALIPDSIGTQPSPSQPLSSTPRRELPAKTSTEETTQNKSSMAVSPIVRMEPSSVKSLVTHDSQRLTLMSTQVVSSQSVQPVTRVDPIVPNSSGICDAVKTPISIDKSYLTEQHSKRAMPDRSEPGDMYLRGIPERQDTAEVFIYKEPNISASHATKRPVSSGLQQREDGYTQSRGNAQGSVDTSEPEIKRRKESVGEEASLEQRVHANDGYHSRKQQRYTLINTQSSCRSPSPNLQAQKRQAFTPTLRTEPLDAELKSHRQRRDTYPYDDAFNTSHNKQRKGPFDSQARPMSTEDNESLGQRDRGQFSKNFDSTDGHVFSRKEEPRLNHVLHGAKKREERHRLRSSSCNEREERESPCEMCAPVQSPRVCTPLTQPAITHTQQSGDVIDLTENDSSRDESSRESTPERGTRNALQSPESFSCQRTEPRIFYKALHQASTADHHQPVKHHKQPALERDSGEEISTPSRPASKKGVDRVAIKDRAEAEISFGQKRTIAQSPDEHFQEWRRRQGYHNQNAYYPDYSPSGDSEHRRRSSLSRAHDSDSRYVYIQEDTPCGTPRMIEEVPLLLGPDGQVYYQDDSYYSQVAAAYGGWSPATAAEGHGVKLDHDGQYRCASSCIFMPSGQLFAHSVPMAMSPMTSPMFAPGHMVPSPDDVNIHPHCLMTSPYAYNHQVVGQTPIRPLHSNT
ncbi:uncharacterized protein LOC5521514 isoform X2 [Nematostella vectensis]|nr:uncharacterized protein LOC5521514 isoform X2 [Nematostella vectensis]